MFYRFTLMAILAGLFLCSGVQAQDVILTPGKESVLTTKTLTTTAGSAYAITRTSTGSDIREVEITWTSDGSGNADIEFTAYGFLLLAVHDDTGTDTPTTGYDLILERVDGETDSDMFLTLGTDMDGTAYGQFTPVLTDASSNPVSLVPLTGKHYLKVRQAGASKVGRLWLLIK